MNTEPTAASFQRGAAPQMLSAFGMSCFYVTLPIYQTSLASELPGFDLWGAQLFNMGFFNIASALGCLLLYRRVEHGTSGKPVSLAACYALFALAHAFSAIANQAFQLPWVSHLTLLPMGLASSFPRIKWVAELVTICQRHGPACCIATLALNQSLALCIGMLLSPAIALMGPLLGPLLFVCLSLGASLVCHHRLEARRVSSDHPEQPATSAPGYRPASSAVILLCCFGITLSVSKSMGLIMEEQAAHLAWHQVAISAVAVGWVVYLAQWATHQGIDNYGSIIKYAVAISAGTLASTTLLTLFAPMVSLAVTSVASTTVSFSMMLFSICICCDSAYRPYSVISANIGVYVAASGVACLAAIPLFGLSDQRTVLQALALAAVLAALIVIPRLPSNISKATVFTLKKFPENETPQERFDRTCSEIAASHGLTPREEEVFVLAIEGAPHKEIAQRLSISTWTVRDYMGSIYKKTSTHSVKELIALVNS